jgi:hypothetical protein
MITVGVFEQIEHDRIVAARTEQLGLLFRVLADPEITKDSSASGLYPDIIVIDDDHKIIYIEEVETESTLTEEVRNEQWTHYSRFGYPFNLIVPSTELLKARYLIKGLKIHKLYFYKSTRFGIRFYQVHNFDIQ